MAIGELTLALTAADHAARRLDEPEIAAHVIAVRIAQIRDNAPRVVRDELWTRVPIAPSAEATAVPAGPQRSDVRLACRW